MLRLYSRAVELRQLEAAELLLQSLETLATKAPEVSETVDEAYMRIAHGR